MNTNNNLNKREKNAELPLFSYESVSAATNNFLAMNNLGGRGLWTCLQGMLHFPGEFALNTTKKNRH
jgi:hypothetical protein